MSDDQIIEAAVQGHASTRDAIRWAINQVRKQREEKFCETHCSWSDHHADCDQVRVDAEPVAWYTEDHLTDKSATTWSKDAANRWRSKGWPVFSLYTHPTPAVVRQLVDVLNIAEDYIVEALSSHDASYDHHPAMKAERDLIVQDLEKLKAALAAVKENGL